MKGTLAETYTREGFMQKQQMIWNLPFYCGVCSNDIHSQLQRNEQAFSLFDFCINPSHEDSVQIVYYKGFMQNTCCSPRVTGGMFCINLSHE